MISTTSCRYSQVPDSTTTEKDFSKKISTSQAPKVLFQSLQLVAGSFLAALLVIGWEDISLIHLTRQYQQQQDQTTSMLSTSTSSTSSSSSLFGSFGSSTVRGLAFSERDRKSLALDLEPQSTLSAIRSLSEVSIQHRSERLPWWRTEHQDTSASTSTSMTITRRDVEHSVQTIQLALLHFQECKVLANDYEWDALSTAIASPKLHSELEQACALLKRANDFLSSEARQEIGFDWGSCAWRHCGALADAEEAMDELDHLIGILEPFECLFVLDVVERSFRDMLAVTQDYGDRTIVISDYVPLQRMSDATDVESGIDGEYLAALEFLKSLEE